MDCATEGRVRLPIEPRAQTPSNHGPHLKSSIAPRVEEATVLKATDGAQITWAITAGRVSNGVVVVGWGGERASPTATAGTGCIMAWRCVTNPHSRWGRGGTVVEAGRGNPDPRSDKHVT